MGSNHFRFKQFTIYQERNVFKVGTDGVILGAGADVAGTNNILDIGAGTGLISIMIAQRSSASVTAIEPEPDSYRQLVQNINSCKWHNRIKAINTSLQDLKTEESFDLIVSNPPFFISSLKSPSRERTIARHNDFLSHEDLIKGVDRLLADSGRFQVILPTKEGKLLIAEASLAGLFLNSILYIKPTPSRDVMRVLLSFSRKKLELSESNLTIEQEGRHKYSDKYIDLTKEFYLKF